MTLAEIIANKIRATGPVSFRDFMEMCLYYPSLGYYTSPGDKIGRNGDYYTSPDLTPAFGALIGKQIEQIWEHMEAQNFTIVEYGAGTGILCRDIVRYLEGNKELYRNLQYCIIERSSEMRLKQKKLLTTVNVCWYNTIEEISPVTGCILSNEMIDNFPVHQVVMQHELKEIHVDYEDDFVELLVPASYQLKNYLAELKINLPFGYRTEINLDVIDWISKVSRALKKGYLVTIDYGDTSDGLYKKYRSDGTIVCYHKHSVNTYPYKNIGIQDITAHVNFSALYHWGKKNQLKLNGFANQADFLLSLGINDYFDNLCVNKIGWYNEYLRQAVSKHTLLVEMGNKFKVMIQQKSVPEYRLKGVKNKHVGATSLDGMFL